MDLYEKYISIQKEIDKLTATQESIRVAIAETLPEEGYKDDAITIGWSFRTEWEYNPEVKMLEEKVKLTKKEHQDNGLAKKSEKKILTIRVK